LTFSEGLAIINIGMNVHSDINILEVFMSIAATVFGIIGIFPIIQCITWGLGLFSMLIASIAIFMYGG
jgi:hypothetical protein